MYSVCNEPTLDKERYITIGTIRNYEEDSVGYIFDNESRKAIRSLFEEIEKRASNFFIHVSVIF